MKVIVLLSVLLTGCVGESRPEPINSYLVSCIERGGLREVLRGKAYCNNAKQLPRFR